MEGPAVGVTAASLGSDAQRIKADDIFLLPQIEEQQPLRQACQIGFFGIVDACQPRQDAVNQVAPQINDAEGATGLDVGVAATGAGFASRRSGTRLAACVSRCSMIWMRAIR